MGRKSLVPALEAKVGMPINRYLEAEIKDGKEPGQIAEALGISQSTVYDFIKKLGLKDQLKTAHRNPLLDRNAGELRQLFDEMLTGKESAGRDDRTIRAFHYSMDPFFRWLDETKKPCTLASWNRKVLEEYLLHLRTDPNHANGRDRSESKPLDIVSIHSYFKRFQVFGFWLMRQEKTAVNPVKLMEPMRLPKRLTEDIPDEGLQAILASFDNSFEGIRDKAIVMAFLDTGMRLEDMTELTEEQFDWQKGISQVIGKGDKERLICFSGPTLEQVNKYRALRGGIAQVPQLWVAASGRRLYKNDIQGMVKDLNRLGKALHLKRGARLHPHLFRHVFARTMWENGVSLQDMMAMGGWETIEMAKHYADAYDAKKAWQSHEKGSPIMNLLKKEVVSPDKQESDKTPSKEKRSNA